MRVNKYNIGKRRKKLKALRKELESTQLKAFHKMLPARRIRQIYKGNGDCFRNRLLTPPVTVFHMLNAAISREKSFQSAWHNIGQTGRSDRLARARQRLPLNLWQELHEWSIKQIGDEFKPEIYWRGHRVIGVDGTGVSMSDEPELTKVFGKSGSKHGASRFPIARVVFTFLLNPLIALGHKIGPYKTSENALFSELLKSLQAGDLIIGDRRYAGAPRYVEYQRAGLEFITRAHHRLKVELLKVIQVLGKNDLVVELPISPTYRRKDPTLPKSIPVRVIKTRIKIRGKKTSIWLVTSLPDGRKYPAAEIKLWYKRRWKLEGLMEEIKISLGADILRSKKEAGIYKELYSRVMAFNLTHWLIMKAGRKHHKAQERISVSATIRLTIVYSLKMSTAPDGQIPLLYEELLEKIADSTVSSRPGRSEPRMKKRDQKHYSILKISRAEWRAINEKSEYVTKVKIRA
jgi:hypothetical protein